MAARLHALSDSEAARIATVLVEMHAPFHFWPHKRPLSFPGVTTYGQFVVAEEFLVALDIRLHQMNVTVYRDGQVPAGGVL